MSTVHAQGGGSPAGNLDGRREYWLPQDPGEHLDLRKISWRGPVGRSLPARFMYTVKTQHVVADIFHIHNLLLSHHAAIFLLHGGTLAQIFDGACYPQGEQDARKVKPFMLVRSEIPELVMPPPRVSFVALAMLTEVMVNMPTHVIREELFYDSAGRVS